MRKPKYSLPELRQKHKLELKKVSKKNPVYKKRMQERQIREILNQKEKLKNYKGFEKLKVRYNERINKLYEDSKNNIKGKSKKEISKFWKNYSKKKQNITESFRERSLKFSSTGLQYFTGGERVFTKDKTYSVSKSDPDMNIKKFIEDKINDDVTNFLIILKGKNEDTGETVYISDSFSLAGIMTGRYNMYKLFTDLVESIKYRGTKSSENFILKNIYVKVIYRMERKNSEDIEKNKTTKKERLQK